MLGQFDDTALATIERENPEGLSSQQILDMFRTADVRLTEATLRKYVQLGLLPRSVRVGKKGKHQGSQGLYPKTVVRQIVRIREMMAQDFTIEQIQTEVLFVRGDIEELERVLGRVFDAFEGVATGRPSEPAGRAITGELSGARKVAHELVEKLTSIEQRLIARVRLARIAG
jgi:DNA-binding transcriptional MerR regulator